MLTRPLGDVIVFMPPLASTFEQLEAMIAIMKEAIIETTEKGANGQPLIFHHI